MKSLLQSSTLHRSFLALQPLTPLKSRGNHVSLAHLRPSSSSTDDIPKKFDLTAAHLRITSPSPPPAGWNNFVGPNRSNIVKRQRKYSKALKICDNYFDVHYWKEKVIELPLDKVVISDDLEILIEAQVYYINVENAIFPSIGNKGIDPIAELTDLLKTTFPFQKMIEEVLFCPKFVGLQDVYRRGCFDQEKSRFLDFKLFNVFGNICRKIFKHPGFEIDDHINKITAIWGVRCLCVKIRFYLSRDLMPTNEEWQLKKDHITYGLLRLKTDKIIRATEVLSAYYKSIKEDDDTIITSKANPTKCRTFF